MRRRLPAVAAIRAGERTTTVIDGAANDHLITACFEYRHGPQAIPRWSHVRRLSTLRLGDGFISVSAKKGETKMAVGIRNNLLGVTQEQFDALNKQLDMAGDPPAGLIFHASGSIEGGWGVIAFWESREAFDAFVPRIQQSVHAAGIELQGPPDITEFPVHETFSPPAH